MWFKTDLKYIPLHFIKDDKFFNFTEYTSQHLETLKLSISRLGVVNPVILQPLQGMYRIVVGFGRFFAAKQLKLSFIPARVLKDDLPPSQILKFILLLHSRKFSLAEKARLIKIMNLSGLSSKQIVREFGSYLEVNSQEIVRAYLKISNYHPGFLSYLSTHGVSLKHSLSAEGLSFQEQGFFLFLANSLSLKGYDLNDILTDLREIAMLERKKVLTVVKDLKIPEILEDPTLTRSQKINKIKKIIKKERFPILSKINQNLEKISKKLKFTPGTEVTWDSKLEEPGLKISFRITQPEMAKSIAKDLLNKTNISLINELLRIYYEGLSDKEDVD